MEGGGKCRWRCLDDIVARDVERRRIAMAKRSTEAPHCPAMPQMPDRHDPRWSS